MGSRQTHIDAFKCIGSQFIVLHHFSAYGPLADAAHRLAPALAGWFYDYARMAVQIFLVLGGYLALQGLLPAMQRDAGALGRTVLQRYLRLALPLLAALGLTVLAALLARQWLQADFIPALPAWGQTLAHALLLQDVVDAEALSAGVWYVAIDLQLYALLALLLWLGQRGAGPAPALWLVAGLMLASLLYFNRDARWDDWGLYFFGSYALGALAAWATRSPQPLRWLGALAGLGLLALLVDWRARIALALGVALLLGLAQLQGGRKALLTTSPGVQRMVQALGRTSYALFLVHFAVLMLVNALLVQLGWQHPLAVALMLALGWAGCMTLAFTFERRIEAPLQRRVSAWIHAWR